MITGIQLKRGESLICDIIEENEDHYVIEKPLLMVLVPQEQPGRYGIELFPYNPFTSDSRQKLPIDMVATPFNVKPELRNKYTLFFGGIQVPETGIKSLIRD